MLCWKGNWGIRINIYLAFTLLSIIIIIYYSAEPYAKAVMVQSKAL